MCLLMLFAKIKFLRKFPNLQYAFLLSSVSQNQLLKKYRFTSKKIVLSLQIVSEDPDEITCDPLHIENYIVLYKTRWKIFSYTGTGL